MTNPPRVVITGVSGFVGRTLAQDLARRGWRVLGLARSVPRVETGIEIVQSIDGVNAATGRPWLSGGDCVVHLAARVHLLKETASDPLAEFRRVNVDGTLALARQAARAGVRRFIFLSSVKVHGEYTKLGAPFTETDTPDPQDPYARSKMEAEEGLRELAHQSAMEVVIIRPPLVYGPGVKANFAALLRAVDRGWLLPLGAIHNQRSLVSLDNLTDFIARCLTHPAASGQTVLVSDGKDVSTTELLRKMGAALGRPARLLPVPQAWLERAARAVGRPELAQRLCGSLQLDITKARTLLDWQPPLTLEEGLTKAMREHARAHP